MRVTVLAPGDLIRQAERELRARGINSRVVDDTNVDLSKVNYFRALQPEDSTTSFKTGEEEKTAPRPARPRRTSLIAQTDVANAISERYGIEVGDASNPDHVKDSKTFIAPGPSLMSALGVTPEARQRTKDLASRLRKTHDIPKLSAETSLAEMLKIAPDVNTEQTVSHVQLVTNDPRYLKVATHVFFAPSGDEGWKVLAREVARRGVKTPGYFSYTGKRDSESQVVDEVIDEQPRDDEESIGPVVAAFLQFLDAQG